MKAPDKIYLNIPKVLYEKDQEIVATWDTQEWDDCVNPEYIRKSALMEWLEGKKKHYMDRQEYDCGWNDLLDELIEKLKEK